MLRDLLNDVDVRVAVPPQTPSAATAIVGLVIDTQGASGVLFSILLGTLTGALTTAVVLLEHGDVANLSDAAAVDDADLNGTELLAGWALADSPNKTKLGYVGSKRYVRLTLTPTGNNASHPVAASCVLMMNSRPTANPTV
jgi:hypothetical protein